MRLDNDCADLCTVAARILARQTGYDAPTTMAIIEATRTVLRASADAAEEFAGTPYFELSAKECRETEQLLGRPAEQMGSSDAGEGYPTSPPSATTPAGASMGGGAEMSGTSEASSQEVSEEQLREMNMDELRDMARDKGLSGVHDMRKEELIDAISGKRGS
ncbi:Rho termination factor N-terminal domain-containing protein [Streptomyces sp. DH24]|uniref:Rho termination factor N-terminal domain-containing protein n=1 Tax=Streptomyces sp. DH24 TaxID=3040123 RepID=UPI002441B58A|nr:Rho termination factor N-terminal domain-containing protein [Streptomyces sp. DH24]MDG9720449.1 Rho termination factor N-terminal domain-containing protein [Streptomyces sp. DH24]